MVVSVSSGGHGGLDWRSVETLVPPKDGTYVMLYSPSLPPHYVVAAWDNEVGYFLLEPKATTATLHPGSKQGWWLRIAQEVSHWLPLPPPPMIEPPPIVSAQSRMDRKIIVTETVISHDEALKMFSHLPDPNS